MKMIEKPEGGWKERTWYLVDVSFRSSNPIHRALFYTGFLDENKPGNYNQLVAAGYEDHITYSEVYYLKVIREAVSADDLISSYKLPPSRTISGRFSSSHPNIVEVSKGDKT